MDANNPNIEKRSTPQWALYQRENFWKANDGQVPPFNTRTLLYPPIMLEHKNQWLTMDGRPYQTRTTSPRTSHRVRLVRPHHIYPLMVHHTNEAGITPPPTLACPTPT